MDETTRQKMQTRVARLEQQIRAFKQLHADELQLILDELSSFRAELAAMAQSAQTPPAPANDPAANSPKRAAWLAEERRKDEERRAPLSRREFLRGGKSDEPGPGSDDSER